MGIPVSFIKKTAYGDFLKRAIIAYPSMFSGKLKRYRENIIIFFFANTNLAYYQVCFFNVFRLEFEKVTTRTCCINYLVFFNHKTLPKPLICICDQSNSCCHAKLFFSVITVHQSSQITFIKLYSISTFNLRCR